MEHSLTRSVAEYGMQLCQTHVALKGIPMRHSNDGREAKAPSLTFEATEQEKTLRAIQGLTMLELSIEYMAPASVSQQRIDLIVASIAEAFQTANNRLTPAQGKFTDLIIDDGGTAEPSRSRNLFKQAFKVPIIAKLL